LTSTATGRFCFLVAIDWIIAAYKAPLPAKMQAAFRLHPAIRQHTALFLLAGALALAGCQKDNPAADAQAQDAQVTATLDDANRQLAAGQVAPAIAALEALRAANPHRYDIVENLALAEAHAGNLTQAAKLFADAATHDPTRHALFIYAAGMDSTAADHAGAVEQYHAYLTYFPKDAAAWKSLAREFRALNQPQAALDAYLEALKWMPGNQPSAPEAVDIANLFIQVENPTQADFWFRNALQLQPDDATAAQARLGLLALAAQHQNWPDAEKLIADLDANATGKTALDASPLATTRDQLRQWHAAQDAIQREQAAAALAATQRAAQLAALANPATSSNATASTPLASNTTSAISANVTATTPAVSNTTASTSALAANTTASDVPDNADVVAEPATPPDPLLVAAQQAQDAGKYPDAIRAYLKALAKDDTSPDTWLGLAQAYYANKQYPNAASIAQEAIRRAPDNPVYTVYYLQVVKASQSPARYQTELVAASSQFPVNADIALALADSFQQQGDIRDATSVLTDFLHRAPDDPRRPEVQDALDNLPASKAKSP
jgi:tetratricopeptide (TPR) repeat protein